MYPGSSKSGDGVDRECVYMEICVYKWRHESKGRSDQGNEGVRANSVGEIRKE